MQELPTGTVTFLFTDIEGSTRLLTELGASYVDVLAEHRRRLREAFGKHAGVEVDTQGDAFFFAFARASDAVAAAAEAQEVLSELPLRVRMGVHTGEPVLTEEGYVGLDVHRAARVAAAGHGGQVLVSQATHDLAGFRLRDLGEHRLKDLSAAERIFQLGDDEFPPLKTLYATNLPVPTTPFVGRERELAEVAELIGRSRLVTITGTGGGGKTRLGLQAAAAAADSYPAGVWWVALAPAADPSEVLPAVGRALGVAGSPADGIADRAMLVLLDNFEHVMAAAAEVELLLEACPNLTLLVTSRERLRVTAEQVYPAPLLDREDAVSLFTARARASDPSFEADEHVDQICARLEDLPLALELAAARTGMLTPEQLLARLGDRLDLLRGGRDSDLRQATLRATIAWSYELLSSREQELFAALSVFRGGFTLIAAEKVCSAELELLESLADKSLIRRWDKGRFGMLETIREFASERAADLLDREALLAALLDYLLEFAGTTNLSAESLGRQRHDLVAPEHENVVTALEFAATHDRRADALELLSELENYWLIGDPLGLQLWLDRLDLDESSEPALRGRVWRLRAGTLDMTADHVGAEPAYARSIEAFRAAGDEDAAMHVLHRVAMSHLQAGDLERAAELEPMLLEHDRRGNRRRDEAVAVALGAYIALARDDVPDAIEGFRASAEIAENAGFVWWRLLMLAELAQALCEPDSDAAAITLREAVVVLQQIGDRVNTPALFLIGALIAAARADAGRLGFLLGALEGGEQRELIPTWHRAREEAAAAAEKYTGPELEAGRVSGRSAPVADVLDLLACEP
jgi:predicted ATPase